MSQLKKGAILSYFNIIASNVIGLFLTPYIIKSLGTSEYGLYLLIGSLVTYVALMDLGLNNTIIRFIALYKVEKDKEKEQKFLSTVMFIYFVISFIIIILGTLLYFKLDNLFSLSEEQLEKAKMMFLILIINLSISLPGGSFSAICSGYEKFVFPRLLIFFRYILRALTLLLVLHYGGDSVSIVIVDTIFNITFICITGWYVFQILKVKIRFVKLDWSYLKHIFSYSIWIFVYAIVQQFQWQSGQIVLGMYSTTITVAIFGVGVMLGTYYGAFASAFNSVLLPRATQMIYNKKTSEELTNEMIKIGRIIFIVLNLVLIGFFLLGKEFILLWVGKEYQDSWFVAFLIMLVLTIPLTQSFGNSILEANNKIKLKALLNLITICFGVLLGYFLSLQVGLRGMIIGITIAMFFNTVFTNLFFVKIFKFKVIHFLRGVFLKNIILSLFLIFLYQLANNYSVEISWLVFFVKLVAISIVYLVFVYSFILNEDDKKMIFKLKR